MEIDLLTYVAAVGLTALGLRDKHPQAWRAFVYLLASACDDFLYCTRASHVVRVALERALQALSASPIQHDRALASIASAMLALLCEDKAGFDQAWARMDDRARQYLAHAFKRAIALKPEFGASVRFSFYRALRDYAPDVYPSPYALPVEAYRSWLSDAARFYAELDEQELLQQLADHPVPAGDEANSHRWLFVAEDDFRDIALTDATPLKQALVKFLAGQSLFSGAKGIDKSEAALIIQAARKRLSGADLWRALDHLEGAISSGGLKRTSPARTRLTDAWSDEQISGLLDLARARGPMRLAQFIQVTRGLAPESPSLLYRHILSCDLSSVADELGDDWSSLTPAQRGVLLCALTLRASFPIKSLPAVVARAFEGLGRESLGAMIGTVNRALHVGLSKDGALRLPAFVRAVVAESTPRGFVPLLRMPWLLVRTTTYKGALDDHIACGFVLFPHWSPRNPSPNKWRALLPQIAKTMQRLPDPFAAYGHAPPKLSWLASMPVRLRTQLLESVPPRWSLFLASTDGEKLMHGLPEEVLMAISSRLDPIDRAPFESILGYSRRAALSYAKTSLHPMEVRLGTPHLYSAFARGKPNTLYIGIRPDEEETCSLLNNFLALTTDARYPALFAAIHEQAQSLSRGHLAVCVASPVLPRVQLGRGLSASGA